MGVNFHFSQLFYVGGNWKIRFHNFFMNQMIGKYLDQLEQLEQLKKINFEKEDADQRKHTFS